MTGTDPATVGILTEPYLYEWQVRAIDRLQQTVDVDIPLVVCNACNTDCEVESWNTTERISRGDLMQFFDVVRQEKAWTVVLAERSIARLLGNDQTLWHRHSIENVAALADAEHIWCEPRTDDGWNELPEKPVARLADHCDVVIRFGFGLIKGDVLTAPEYGVLSFHPADIRTYRGLGPPVIFHDGQHHAGSTLQRLNESIDGGEIVAHEEVNLEDCYTLWDVFDRIATLQIELLTAGIIALRDPTVTPQAVSDDQLGEFNPRARRRTFSFAGRVLAKNLAGRIRRKLDRRRSNMKTVDRARTHASDD